MPNVYEACSRQGSFGEIPPTRLDKNILLALPDPVYCDAQAAYRFSLRLMNYASHIPNHTLLRFISKSDHGDTHSHLIKIFSK